MILKLCLRRRKKESLYLMNWGLSKRVVIPRGLPGNTVEMSAKWRTARLEFLLPMLPGKDTVCWILACSFRRSGLAMITRSVGESANFPMNFLCNRSQGSVIGCHFGGAVTAIAPPSLIGHGQSPLPRECCRR